ncbi:DNA alkylation repair protein [Chloroflexota bacterium]
MVSEQILTLEKRITDLTPTHKSPQLPGELFHETSTLSDEDALELTSRLFMMSKWNNISSGVRVIQEHPTAKTKINREYLEPLGNRMDSWGLVDAFSCLAGPAWRVGQISDEWMMSWTRSENRWWRRAALVCTVFLNRKAQGGTGDTPRTLMVCEPLVSDRDDMVVKGMSWALRDLLKRDRQAVERFLEEHENELAARVKREVRNKLTTGVKNPRRKQE